MSVYLKPNKTNEVFKIRRGYSEGVKITLGISVPLPEELPVQQQELRLVLQRVQQVLLLVPQKEPLECL
jgi:hypothetical protein